MLPLHYSVNLSIIFIDAKRKDNLRVVKGNCVNFLAFVWPSWKAKNYGEQ